MVRQAEGADRNVTFMNFNYPSIGVAATDLLEALGFEVIILKDRKCCGRPMISKGLLDMAGENARYNVDLLYEYVERGIKIAGCESSCVMAIKDEYEVARLFTDGAFAKAVEDAFEGTTAIEFHMAPPLFARTDPRTGHPMKRRFGPWMMGALKLLARAKRIRGTLLDPFRFNRERTMEKALIERFEAVVAQLAKGLSTGNLATAHQTVEAFDSIRGYGHVKLANHGRAIALIDERLANWRDTGKVVQISGTSTDRKAVG